MSERGRRVGGGYDCPEGSELIQDIGGYAFCYDNESGAVLIKGERTLDIGASPIEPLCVMPFEAGAQGVAGDGHPIRELDLDPGRVYFMVEMSHKVWFFETMDEALYFVGTIVSIKAGALEKKIAAVKTVKGEKKK